MTRRSYTPEEQLDKQLLAEFAGKRIKALLEEKNITQRFLSQQLGFNPASVNHILSGKVLGETYTYWRIARILGVSISELFGDSDNNRVARRELKRTISILQMQLDDL